MTLSLPQIYGLSIANMEQKINDMIKLGYTRNEIIKMSKTCPFIFSHNIDNIKQKINDLEACGYNNKDIIKITKSFPCSTILFARSKTISTTCL